MIKKLLAETSGKTHPIVGHENGREGSFF
ncbi:hypothetical protein FOXB_05306 [Fusarium oxysporum f. sp. conglutinans Fo5176]|uniref:Uncharacterized protein n=1 Tax=Fusarium oxysporum (strain Fo5176) TaxID=660025 RepID=F9FFX7_FUSOF|nr:hypothetical protein FOXB_05306 [Fusarium oxysporum f. sp. conglutinans Fo5176]